MSKRSQSEDNTELPNGHSTPIKNENSLLVSAISLLGMAHRMQRIQLHDERPVPEVEDLQARGRMHEHYAKPRK
jgi:PIN domain nuclease of toxin-antitoxin system